MIVYKKVAGRASDLRFAPNGYATQDGEIVLTSVAWPNQDVLPPIESLNDPLTPTQIAQQQIAEIDAQMAAMEQAKLIGRTVREDMIWGIVKDYLRDVAAVNPASATADQISQAVAALTNPQDPHYNAGFTRLKAFDDQFVALRAQRAQLVAQLNG